VLPGAILGAILLLVWAAPVSAPWEIAAVAVYAATLIATFTASAFYHLTPWEGLRPALRRIDHAAIYLKIAGILPLDGFHISRSLARRIRRGGYDEAGARRRIELQEQGLRLQAQRA